MRLVNSAPYRTVTRWMVCSYASLIVAVVVSIFAVMEVVLGFANCMHASEITLELYWTNRQGTPSLGQNVSGLRCSRLVCLRNILFHENGARYHMVVVDVLHFRLDIDGSFHLILHSGRHRDDVRSRWCSYGISQVWRRRLGMD